MTSLSLTNQKMPYSSASASQGKGASRTGGDAASINIGPANIIPACCDGGRADG